MIRAMKDWLLPRPASDAEMRLAGTVAQFEFVTSRAGKRQAIEQVAQWMGLTWEQAMENAANNGFRFNEETSEFERAISPC